MPLSKAKFVNYLLRNDCDILNRHDHSMRTIALVHKDTGAEAFLFIAIGSDIIEPETIILTCNRLGVQYPTFKDLEEDVAPIPKKPPRQSRR